MAAEAEVIVRKVVSSLRPRQQQIIKLRYGIGCAEHTLQQVAEVVGLTRARVGQIQLIAEETLAMRLRLEGFEPRITKHAVTAGKQPDAQAATGKAGHTCTMSYGHVS